MRTRDVPGRGAGFGARDEVPDDSSVVVHPTASRLVCSRHVQLIELSRSRQEKSMLVIGGVPEMPRNIPQVVDGFYNSTRYASADAGSGTCNRGCAGDVDHGEFVTPAYHPSVVYAGAIDVGSRGSSKGVHPKTFAKGG